MMAGIYALIIVGTMCGALGGFFFKKAVNVPKIWMAITKPQLYIGGTVYVLSAVLNIIVLRYLPYSVTLPLMAITYIWTLLISAKLLGEKITRRKVAGVVLVLLGAVLLSFSL